MTPGSSMDRAILEEAESLIYGSHPISPEKAENLEAIEYGEQVTNESEANDQRIIEMQLVVASKGWQYIVSLWQQLVIEAEKEMKDPNLSDELTIIKKRDWLALKKAVTKTLNTVQHAANLPLSTDLPS